MEWNAKTPSQWDWENLAMFSGKASDNGSVYSSGGGNFSGSDLGHGSSSKSSISASMDSSSKGGAKISEFNFETVEGFPKDLSKKKELTRAKDTGTSPTLGPSVGSGEPLIGLKLGKRTYFEDVCAGGTVKASSFSVIPTSSATTTTTKRSRASYQNTQTPRCQVEGCNLDLTLAKDYHRRHRICENHSKCPKVIIAGLERRFCQQCSRFHDLLEFDEKKRSCRRRLSDHNARRRKPQPEAIQINSARLSSSFYDGRQQMSLVLNRMPLHARPVASPTWESICSFKLTQSKGSLMRPSKTGGTNGQLHLPNNEFSNAISMLRHDFDRPLPFKGTTTEVLTTEVLNQGVEASMATSNLDATPDLWRALSLLSTNTWGSGDPDHTSLDQLMHVNHTSLAQPVMPSVPQGLSLASSEYWQAEQQSAEARVQSLAMHNNGSGQFQEFQLFKAPYESGFFCSNQMN